MARAGVTLLTLWNCEFLRFFRLSEIEHLLITCVPPPPPWRYAKEQKQEREQGDNRPTLTSHRHFYPVAWGKEYRQFPPKKSNQCVHSEVITNTLTRPE